MKKLRFHSGFITLLGRPNVGKSTLLNHLIGQQISITANKPQTTRNNIRGILTEDRYQAIFIDTPGVHLPQNELHRRIVNYATQSIRDSDLIFFLTEPLRSLKDSIPKADELVLDYLDQKQNQVVLIINKIDLTENELLLKTIEVFNQKFSFLETMPVSALKEKGIDRIKTILPKYLPEGIPYFPEDQMTDTPERVIVAEFVREQLMRLCFQEIPYGTAVTIEAFKETEKIINVFATIYIEREAHKKIIIGKKGSMLKKVGQNARHKMERMLGKKVFLSLHVKISKNWINNPRKLNEFGYSES